MPAHAEQNLSSTQSAELIADHFSKISQEFSPLDLSCLPSNVKSFLANYDENLAPKLSTFDVHARIIKAKKPNSSVPGDIPKKLVQHCSETLSIQFNSIFPTQWKIEYQRVITKSSPAESEEDLRNVARTPF